jgi:hypothetical protein
VFGVAHYFVDGELILLLNVLRLHQVRRLLQLLLLLKLTDLGFHSCTRVGAGGGTHIRLLQEQFVGDVGEDGWILRHHQLQEVYVEEDVFVHLDGVLLLTTYETRRKDLGHTLAGHFVDFLELDDVEHETEHHLQHLPIQLGHLADDRLYELQMVLRTQV